MGANMTRRMARPIIGTILAALGLLWVLQGANVFGASGGMNGQHVWILTGAIVGAAGLGVIASLDRRLGRH